MGEPEAVKMAFACGPGMCDMDVSTALAEGTRIFAGGAEGMIKVLDPTDLENPVRELNLDVDDSGDEGLAVTALAVSPTGDELAVGLRNGDVKLHDLPSLAFKSNLTRFTAPVLGLAYGMDGGGVIAACGEEPGIKVVRRNNNGKVLTLEDLDGGAKSVAWDPKGEFLAAAGFDGKVVVWKVDPTLDSLSTEVVSAETYFDKEAPGGGGGPDGFVHLGKIAWHPEGKSLCVTGGTDPLILERETWKRSMMIPEDAEQGGHVKEITVAAFSPDGRSLATSALDGRVVLWSVNSERAVKMYVNTEDENWRHLRWLDDSSLAGLSIAGSVCTLENAATLPATKEKDSTAKHAANGVTRGGQSKGIASGGKRGPSFSKDLFDDEAAEDNGDVSDTDAADAGEVDIADDVAVGDIVAGIDGSGFDGREGNGLPGGEGDSGALDGMLDAVALDPAAAAPQVQVQVTPLQDPFQPSSTPLGDARRYLCWNGVGTMISIDENTHNAVEIEFADKAGGRNHRFMDTWNFVMGSLSSTGAIFASVAQDEEDDTSCDSSPSGGRSVLYYKALGRRSSAGEWTRMMPKGENVLGVAVGRGWAAAATDRQFVRLFTASGLQGETVMLPGPVVTMVGGGNLLAVVFHKGEPMGESQNLGYQLLDMNGKRELSSGGVCMSVGAELTWLGMSEELMLVTMDSSGLMSALTPSFGWQWTPVLDTLSISKNTKDLFWPVGVVTGKLLAVTLKGGEEHPSAYPRPVLTAVSLSAPSTKSQDGEDMARFEKVFPVMEARVRQRRFNLEVGLTDEDVDVGEMESEVMSQEAQLDTMVVKRIQEACAASRAERAMDLASLIHLEKSFHIAMKVANHHGLTSLAANIEDAMIAKFQLHEEDDEEALDGQGWTRDNASVSRGRAAPDGGEENLGPLDRARLEARRENNNKRVVGPPNGSAVRATASSFSARGADRHGSGNESANDAMVSGGGGDVREQFLQDYDDEETGGRVFKGSKRRKGGAQEVEHHDEGIGNGDIDDDVEEEEEVAAPPSAPKNPFARGKTFSSPPRKKKKDVLETMEDLKASPSPLTKRTALTRLSSFATEARTKKRNDRNIL